MKPRLPHFVLAILLVSHPATAQQTESGFVISNGNSVVEFKTYRDPEPYRWQGDYTGIPGPRPGYRQASDGLWYPDAAFDRQGADYGRFRTQQDKHAAWCFEHHATYRQSDNTFDVRPGGRRVCNSPFD
jgi:hypothetical protein